MPLFRQLGFHRITAAGHKDKALEYGKDVWMRYTLPTQHFLYFGVRALARLAGIREVNKDILQAIEDKLPADRHPDLNVGMAAVTHRLVNLRLNSIGDPAEQIRLLRGLSERLAFAGDHAGALAAAERAACSSGGGHTSRQASARIRYIRECRRTGLAAASSTTVGVRTD